ncbi:hypothetical protein YYG_04224 [Plasmodium vinckei petteri]|uniref:Uncharacterized protein n=1 Tax=Plasmodium vinckei petteri TaxID=138298 RepID=W7AYW9_PLAVN|nr:hypothetical protein YYG_04224 [Plasmodium vinckei petteri]CAD2101283.1 conserved Plasmodium protein, unknown function [Plasmodium vinckei petteri]
MFEAKSYKWYFENGCEIVPLKKPYDKRNDYSLTLLDIQADFSDFLAEEKNIISSDKLAKEEENGFNLQKKQFIQKETKKKSTIEREKYVYEIDYLWAYMEWHYSFEDEIKVQKNLIKDINKLKKVPKLFVSAHIIDGIINEMPKNENLCILKYTTYPNFYKKYNNELDILSKKSNNSIYNVCNYIYEVCDIADKSLTFANSPIINTTVKNVLSITKSGKKREDFNEENEKEEIEEDEIWQIYLSKTLKSINDQWLLICINDELKKIINNSGDIYFKMFNKYIKEYNEFITNHNYNITSNDKETSGNGNNSTHMSNSNMFKNEDKNNFFELNSHNNNLNLEKLKKYKINLIFSENKDINHIIYKLCTSLGRLNDVVLCTTNKTYNILMNDVDGTLAICLKSFFSKYYMSSDIENKIYSQEMENGTCNLKKMNSTSFNDDLIKTLSIMGLCKEKIILSEKATIFNNIELFYSYYLLVHSEALYRQSEGCKLVKEGLTYSEKETNEIDDGVIYISKKGIFENLQFSNEEICSYLMHMQKYSKNNMIYIKNKGFRYIKSEIIYEFLIKMMELISINDNLYEYQYVENPNKISNNNNNGELFDKYRSDLYKGLKKRHGITFLNIMKLIYDNIDDFNFLSTNKIGLEKYIILQLCWKCFDIENIHFEYFNIYYNYYFFYEYLNKGSSELTFESMLENYFVFLNNDEYIDETIVFLNLFKLHNIMSLNIIRSSGKVTIHSENLFTFDMDMFTYIKYVDENFQNFNSNLMDKIIQSFIKSYQFFLDYGYDRECVKKNVSNVFEGENSNTNSKETNEKDNFVDNGTENTIYKDRVLFRNNVILNVNNINHICNDNLMFEYFVVVKYFYSENSFSLLEKKIKKTVSMLNGTYNANQGGQNVHGHENYELSEKFENFSSSHLDNLADYDIHKKYNSNYSKSVKHNYCLNYKIFKYQTNSFPHIRLNNNYNDLLISVFTPLSLHCSIFRENVIYNKKNNSFQLIPSFLLKNNLRSCLTVLFALKNSYYSQEFYPFLNPLLNNKDMIGTIAVPPLRHCRTKFMEKENPKNVELFETENIISSTLNNTIKQCSNHAPSNKKITEKLWKLYNCNLPINNFNL